LEWTGCEGGVPNHSNWSDGKILGGIRGAHGGTGLDTGGHDNAKSSFSGDGLDANGCVNGSGNQELTKKCARGGDFRLLTIEVTF